MKLPPRGCCAWCGGVLRSTEERKALRCWLCVLVGAWSQMWRWN